jgi:diguanylate cyclase (GGDEF)-like protein
MAHLREHIFLQRFKNNHSLRDKRRAVTLLVLQAALLLVLVITILLLTFMRGGDRSIFYIPLMSILIVILAGSILLNFIGKYAIAAWMTAISMIIAPWISILLDPAVRQGDLVPILYVGLSVQLCSVLLSERANIIIAVVEMAAVITVLQTRSHTTGLNWPSLFAFILFTSIVAISYGYVNRKQLEQIHDLSIRDSLTGLFNRRYMEETLDREIDRALRTERNLAVVMADVDHFKSINDTYGHVAGDMVLVHIANFFIQNTRSSDVACRYGGDEFILIMPECSKEEATTRAESIRLMISQAAMSFENKVIEGITISFGIAALPLNGGTREELICSADHALYSSKILGRNRVSS